MDYFLLEVYMDNNNIGILDPEGKHDNPLTGKPYSDRYKELAKKWSTFPVYEKRNEIIDAIKASQVLLIVSSTGSGKSVLAPKLALHTYNYNAKIAMTLPKQIITKAAAEFSAETLDVKLGEEVGYQYKNSPPEAKSDKTKILYCTDGTVVARLMKDPQLSDLDCVLVDEVHEQNTRISFLIYLLREAIKLRPTLKVIFMSATINQTIFKNYFKDFKFKVIDVGGARTYPIDSIFLPKTLEYNGVMNTGFDTLLNILEKDNPNEPGAHDVIFFLTSSNEAFTMCQQLNKKIKEEKDKKCKITCHGDIFCVEVYSGMDANKQTLAQDKELYKRKNNYVRKVVMATNVAESSLTIDGVKYVIDSGYELKGSYDPNLHARKLERELITNAQAKQRMGRAGRTEPGICYHLYTEDEFKNKMKGFPEPEIRTSDITEECLKLLSNEKIENIDQLISTLSNFIEPPKEDYLNSAINNLIQMGVVEDNQINKLGRLIIELPVDNISAAISVIYGKIYNCSFEIMKILSLLDACKGNLSDLYKTPTNILQSKKPSEGDDKQYKQMIKSLEDKFNKTRKKFANKYGDHISILNIYESFFEKYQKYHNNMDKLDDWCYDNFLKLDRLLKAKNNYEKLKQKVNNVIKGKLDPNEYDIKYFQEIEGLDLDQKILACLIIGYRLNTAVKSKEDLYRTQYAKDIRIKLSKLSFLNLKEKEPKNVFYNELFVSMGKNELVIVSEIPKEIIKILV